MKKNSYNIKTITCHDVYNTGASLQAYALHAYLKKLGHRVEIIDYKPDYLKHYELWGVRNPKYDKPIIREVYNILKLPGRVKERCSKRKRAFDNFRNTYLTLTNKIFRSNEELKKECMEADIFFAGSDQIWNTLFQNGKDPAFYIDFAPKKAVRASYAASFATEDVVEEYKSQIGSWISNLDFVSVRERSGLDIIHQLGIENVHQVVDPVFLLSKSEWEELLPMDTNDDEYLIIYDFDNNKELNSKAIVLAKENGWKIYSLFPNEICDKCFFDKGPLEFINLIRNAQMVLSNSFHATAFSIIFGKQFIVYERKEKINTRMRDILTSLDISGNEELIDYDKVNTLLEKQIDYSKKYIDYVLASVGKE